MYSNSFFSLLNLILVNGGWYEMSYDGRYLSVKLTPKSQEDQETTTTHYIKVMDLKERRLHHIFEIKYER